eukprot:COSAG01_NODE_9490_length_2433_cov_3.076692_1_plen_96_part_10
MVELRTRSTSAMAASKAAWCCSCTGRARCIIASADTHDNTRATTRASVEARKPGRDRLARRSGSGVAAIDVLVVEGRQQVILRTEYDPNAIYKYLY